MKTLIILKHELLDIISNKRYMLGFAIQLLLLLTVVPTFSSYLGEEFRLPSPTMKNFVPVGIVDNSKNGEILLNSLAENERLQINYFKYYPSDEIQKGSIAAVIIIPEEYDESLLKQIPVTVVFSASSLKRDSAKAAIEASLKTASEKLSYERKKRLNIETESFIVIERKFLKPIIIERGGSRHSSFFLGYLIPIVLFFPIFMSASLVVDSVVGEKERKTLEFLLTSPVHQSRIILGKFAAIVGFIIFQLLLWMLALKMQGVSIANALNVFLLLTVMNLALTSTAFFLATYSKSIKEANISLMFLYLLVFIFLIISLSIEFFNPRKFFEFSPFNALSRLVVGEPVGAFPYLFLIFASIIYSWVIFSATTKLFNRDDIIYGPRPSLFELFSDAVESMLKRFENTPRLGGSIISLVSGIISAPLSLIYEISIGIVLLYIFGYSSAVITVMILLFAFLEEYLKPITLFSIKKRRPQWISSPVAGAFYGALAGFSFSILENLFVILFLIFSFPSKISEVLTFRTTTLFVHLASSSIVGVGIARDKTRFLIAAAFIHALFNFMLLKGGV